MSTSLSRSIEYLDTTIAELRAELALLALEEKFS